MATQRDIAEHLDLSVKRVSELIRDGVLPSKKGRSPLNIDVCRFSYISYLRKLGGYNKRTGTGDIAEEKTKLTAAQARKAELEVEELEGRLIPSELVEDFLIERFSNVRSKLIGLASKITHQVMTLNEYAEIKQAIDDEIYEALSELAQDDIPRKYKTDNTNNE